MPDGPTGAGRGTGVRPGDLPMADPQVLRVARVLPQTEAEGPGVRTAVWVQGCSIRCQGCFNPDLWNSAGGTTTTPQSLFDVVLNAGVHGLTLLGGEPFDQAAPLAVLAGAVRAAGLSVVTFTGYVSSRLDNAAAAGRQDIADLLRATDLLIDGPYLADRPDSHRPWVGSTNQRMHALTNRFQDLTDRLTTHQDRLEVRIAPDGTLAVNGWADSATLSALLEGL